MMSLYNILEMQDLYDGIVQGNVVVSILQIEKIHTSLMWSVICISPKSSCSLSFHAKEL